jgi:hypothetical protein
MSKKHYKLAAKCCELILMDKPSIYPSSRQYILWMTYEIMSQPYTTCSSFKDTKKHVEYLYCRRRYTDTKEFNDNFIFLDNLKN